jgi:hypothetical protein
VRRLNWLAGACALALLLLGSTAHAQEASPLSAIPPSVSLEGDRTGRLVLVNETGVKLDATLTIGREDGKAGAGGFVMPAKEIEIDPGKRFPLTVTVYGGPLRFLDVVAAPTEALPRGAVLRVPLQEVTPVEPAVSEWAVVHTTAGGDSGTELPLTGPCGNLELSGPMKLGTVQASGEQLTITGSCSDEKTESLELSTSGSGSSGNAYKGKIAVGDGEVDLTVQDKLSGIVTAFLIFLGIVVALAVSIWRGWGRPTGDLLRETRVVEELVTSDNEANVDIGFKKAASELELPENVQEWTIAAAVQQELTELRRPLRRLPSEEQLKKTREALTSLELELSVWPKVANRLGELQQRSDQLAALSHYRQSVWDRTLGRKGPLDLAAMREVKATADEALTLAGDWPDKAIADASALAESLPKGVPVPASFEAVLDRFREAKSAADAKEALSAFRSAEIELRKAAKGAGLDEGMLASASISEPIVLFEPVAIEDPAPSARELAVGIFAIDAVVLGLLLLVALIAGMQALWVDKSFGGAWDVTAALAWGLGAGVIGQPLTSALTDAGRSWVAGKSA